VSRQPNTEVTCMPSKMVDTHPHIVSRDTVRYPVTPIGGTRSEWSKERSVTLEKLVAAINGCFEVLDEAIDHYGGEVDKFLGDAVMATFGAPIAHDDGPPIPLDRPIESFAPSVRDGLLLVPRLSSHESVE